MQRFELCEFDRALEAGMRDRAAEQAQCYFLRQAEKRLPLEFDARAFGPRSEEHTSELQSRLHLVCRLLLEKKNHIQQLIQRTQSAAFRRGPDSSQQAHHTQLLDRRTSKAGTRHHAPDGPNPTTLASPHTNP